MIADSLKSVEKLIDAACIIDAGGSDCAIAIADEWLSKNDTPGGVFECLTGNPYTTGIKKAYQLIKWIGLPIQDVYFLWLDADMILEQSNQFQKQSLTKDSYLILESSPSFRCSIFEKHLLRANARWECNDPVLPSWTGKESSEPGRLNQFTINGGHTNLEKNIQRLTAALELEPDNSRNRLYLAQSYKGLQQYEQAIEEYQQRINLGGDREEIWFSKFMIGSCYEESGKWSLALHWYLEAFHAIPDYPDPIHKIATHYRLMGENDLAYLFAEYGMHLSRLCDHRFYNYPPLRDYQFQEEISIAAYYTRYKEEGFMAACHLFLQKNLPPWVREQNRRNLFYYAPNLKNAKFLPIRLDLPLITEGLEERYHPATLSIIKSDNGYRLICSAINYTQSGGKIFATSDPKGIFRTKNFYLRMDWECNVISQQEIVENLLRERFPAFNVEGLEEGRIFEYLGREWFTCITRDTNPAGRRQISICELPNSACGSKISVEGLLPLTGSDSDQDETNWLPFCNGEKLWFIYSYDPYTIYGFIPQTRNCELLRTKEISWDFSSLKSSAAPIPFDDGYLMLVHEAVHFPDSTQAHLHRFLLLDREYQIANISKPFVFLHQGIERCSGMTYDPMKTEIILSIGIEEREVYLCFLSIESVRSLFFSDPQRVSAK